MLNEIFYRKCIQCGLRSENNSPVCPDCLEAQERYEYFCESCGSPLYVPAKICGRCTSGKSWDKLFISCRYRGPVKKLVRSIKFSYRLNGGETVCAMAETDRLSSYDLVTDVPSHFTRKFRRLSHPAEILAKHLALNLGCEYRKILTRTRITEYQYKLRKIQRASNVKNAFECNINVRGLKILLVDDIITTGSTIEECSRILKKSGASEIDVYALAGGST